NRPGEGVGQRREARDHPPIENAAHGLSRDIETGVDAGSRSLTFARHMVHGAAVKMLRIKRTYDPPARGDGRRILVERLWPRGMRKEAVAADAWMKDVAPSTELRKWFDHRVERWDEFRRRYREELSANSATWRPILESS